MLLVEKTRTFGVKTWPVSCLLASSVTDKAAYFIFLTKSLK